MAQVQIWTIHCSDCSRSAAAFLNFEKFPQLLHRTQNQQWTQAITAPKVFTQIHNSHLKFTLLQFISSTSGLFLRKPALLISCFWWLSQIRCHQDFSRSGRIPGIFFFLWICLFFCIQQSVLHFDDFVLMKVVWSVSRVLGQWLAERLKIGNFRKV